PAQQLERADLVDADRIAVLVDEPDLHALQRLAAYARARARIVAAAGERELEDLGQPVADDDLGAEHGADPRDQALGHAPGAGDRVAQRRERPRRALLFGVVRELRVHRRYREQHRRLVVAQRF